MKIKVETTEAPKAIGPYSQAVVVGDLVFTSGQIYLTTAGQLLEGTIEEQTHQIMIYLLCILKAAGAGFADVVKTTIYVTDMANYRKINEVYGGYFSEPFPARETICVKELPLGAKLEISMIAFAKGKPQNVVN